MTKIVTEGPAGYMPQSAPAMGVELAPKGQALLYGNAVTEEEAMRDAAIALLTKKNPTIFLVLKFYGTGKMMLRKKLQLY